MPHHSKDTAAVLGIDIGKNTFHLVGLNKRGAIILRLKLSWTQLEAKLANLPPCLVGMEACVGAHHLSRRLKALGHDPRLIPARYARAFLKGSKNDFRDAEAIAEAVQRPTMRFVATKTAEQLDLQAFTPGALTPGGIGPSKAGLKHHLASLLPAVLTQPFYQGLQGTNVCPIRSQPRHQGTHAPWFVGPRLLRLGGDRRGERPPDRQAAKKCDELPPPHSITSSARASSAGGTVIPSALAVFRLITSSNLVGACTGRSAGFSPLRIRSTYAAARRYWSRKSGP